MKKLILCILLIASTAIFGQQGGIWVESAGIGSISDFEVISSIDTLYVVGQIDTIYNITVIDSILTITHVDTIYSIGNIDTVVVVTVTDSITGNPKAIISLDHLDAADGDPDSVISVDEFGQINIDGLLPLLYDQEEGTLDALQLRSSTSVAHSFAETNTAAFGRLRKQSYTGGGLSVYGYTDVTYDGALKLIGAIGVSDPTDTHAGVLVSGSKLSGTARAALGNSETVFRIDNYTTPLLSVLGNGNVGIGTSTPQSNLAILGTEFSTASDSFTGIYLDNSGITAGEGTFGMPIEFGKLESNSRKNAAIVGVQDGADSDVMGLAFFTKGSGVAGDPVEERVRISTNGNVGIGTAHPSSALHILNPSGPQFVITDTNKADSTTFEVDGNGDLTVTPSGGDLTVAGSVTATDYILDASLSVDSTWSGTVTTVTAGEAVVFGDLLVQKSDGEYYKTDADAVTTMPGEVMSLSEVGDGESCLVLATGWVCNTDWSWTLGDGQANLLYADDATSGGIVQYANQPSDVGDQVQSVGFVETTTSIHFMPSTVLVEVKE